MGLEDDFKKAAEEAKALPKHTSNDDQLALYGLYKQANFGDADEKSKPGFLDFTGKAKFGAWEKCKGMTKEEAMQAYIMKVAELTEKYSA